MVVVEVVVAVVAIVVLLVVAVAAEHRNCKKNYDYIASQLLKFFYSTHHRFLRNGLFLPAYHCKMFHHLEGTVRWP